MTAAPPARWESRAIGPSLSLLAVREERREHLMKVETRGIEKNFGLCGKIGAGRHILSGIGVLLAECKYYSGLG